MSGAGRRWWSGRVGYEVYLRSFADADGDGVGDLLGLAERLEYLDWLGVDLLWITPCFPSPLADHGYDVADYTRVAEEYGGDAGLARVLDEAHARDMRVLLDLVPNHTSWEHPWFRASRSSRSDPKRDWYLWRDSAPDGGPPNNWVSHFGGPAWTYDEATEQWWCHLFLPEQPDLNWANPEVAEAFEGLIADWLDRGVDGFRIDVAHALVKHPDLPDLPPAAHPGEVTPGDLLSVFDQFDHVYDTNRPGVLEVYRRWRAVAEPRDGLLLGEVYLTDADTLAPYVVDQDGLHLAFWFAPLDLTWEAAEVRKVLAAGAGIAEGSVAWITSSHDVSRAATRLGSPRRALVLATLQHGLPGVPFLYQGEELGLTDVVVDPSQAEDPIAVRAGAHLRSRDVCRTPLPWAPGPGLGFTTAERPWLPMGPRREAETVAVQREDPGSWLPRYRALVALRKTEPDLVDAPLVWIDDVADDVVAYRRGRLLVAANLGAEPATVEVGGAVGIVFASDGEVALGVGALTLPFDAAAVVRLGS